MKANELMIGDLVTFKDCQNDETPSIVKIWQINDDGEAFAFIDGDDALDEIIIDNEIVGIPITPEILEKNGFKFDGSGQRSMMLISTPLLSEGIRYNIYVGLKKKTIEVFVAHPIEKSPNWRKSNKVYLEVCGCYVHELQHALRLCGIEKEIEL